MDSSSSKYMKRMFGMAKKKEQKFVDWTRSEKS